jgi:hypothetical protein
MTTINPSVLASANHLRDMAQKSIDGKPVSLDNEKLAAIADLDKNDSGPTYDFKTKDGVAHHLSVKDFNAAAETLGDLPGAKEFFANLALGVNKKTGNGKIEVKSGMAEVLKTTKVSGGMISLPKWDAKTPDNAASGSMKCRVIKVTDGDPIKIYGKVSPKAEALIADGWLSDNDMHDLVKGNKGWEYSSDGRDVDKSRATKMMSLLYQRQVDHTGKVFGGENYSGGHFSAQDKKDQHDTFAAMGVGGTFTDNAFVSGAEGSGAKGKLEIMSIDFSRPLPVTAPVKGAKGPPPPKTSLPLGNARIALAKVDQAKGVAPEDKAFLKQMVFLKFIAQFPTDSPTSPRPTDMADLPGLSEIEGALKEMGFDKAKNGISSNPKEGNVLAQMVNHPEKYTVVLQQLATKLGIPTEK